MARRSIDKSIEEVRFDWQLNPKQIEALVTPATETLFGGAKGFVNHCPIRI